jgi:hypothetical protein
LGCEAASYLEIEAKAGTTDNRNPCGTTFGFAGIFDFIAWIIQKRICPHTFDICLISITVLTVSTKFDKLKQLYRLPEIVLAC